MDIIAAVATPPVPSAIGILRLSGEGCLALADRLFTPVSSRPLAQTPGHRLVYGRLCTRDGRPLDQCLAAVFRAPASYTGEDALEFQCHGSPVLLTTLLSELLALGARQAEPGEFTRRAFLNGRLDLVQAEAVIDLIDAETPAAAENAAGQLSGAVSETLNLVYNRLMELLARFQAIVDYPDEELDLPGQEELAAVISSDRSVLRGMESTFRWGRYLKEGIDCALVGRPNVGKSSLLNALTGFDRAIVTDLPGTTRDTVSETVVLAGLPVRLTDTAGIRETDDQVERLGVERSLRAAQSAQLVLCVLDAGVPLTAEDKALLDRLRGLPLLILLNKGDLPAALVPEDLASYGPALSVSARTGEGLRELEDAVAARFTPTDAHNPAGTLLTSARQADAIRRAAEALEQSLDALTRGLTPDAVLLDVEQALSALGEVLGRTVPEDLLDTLFSRFCVGK